MVKYAVIQTKVPAGPQTEKDHIYATLAKQLTETIKKEPIFFFFPSLIYQVSKSITRIYGLIPLINY